MQPIDHFCRAVRRWPDRIAVIDGERTFTFTEISGRAMALAATLQDLDPAPQSRVAICAYNTVEHLLAWLAVMASGKTWVALNPRNGNDELNRIMEVVKPTIAVIDDDCLDKFQALPMAVIHGKPADGAAADGLRMADLMAANAGREPVRHDLAPDDLQAIKFTGGSSGVPKGVMQTYRVWNTCIASMIDSFGFDPDDRHLLAAPMTHGANTLIMPIMARGGAQVFMGPAKPATILDAIECHGVTSFFIPPTVLYMMMAEPGLKDRNLSSLRHLIAGGAAMRPEAVREAMPLFNNALETCYGQTEAPQIAICMRAEDWCDDRNLASTGRPTLLTRVEVMDPDGQILAPGEQGEIVLMGDLVMKGYLDMPDKTAETIIDGWLHTGDVGVIDERGFVFIKDRIRDVVITGGFNVFPSDVEAVLGQHPAVKECVVFGVADDKWGEAVHAAVELHDGDAVAEDAIIAFIKERLDSVKAPKRIHFTDALPRSPVGKVLRREAKVLFAAQNETGGAENV